MNSGAGAFSQGGRPEIPPVEVEAWEAIRRSDWGRALALLMEAYGAAVHRFCLRMVQDPELANDMHQTTFVQAYESLAGFKGDALLRTWLYGIARHRCLDALKAERRRKARFEVTDQPPEYAASTFGSAEQLRDHALGARLEECLGNLSARAEEAVLLRYRDGFSYPEMSRICEELPATLQARVARALPVLRRCLRGKGVTL